MNQFFGANFLKKPVQCRIMNPILLFLSFLCLHSVSSESVCPTKGKIGASPIPSILSSQPNQTGYQARVEIVANSQYLVSIEEKYDASTESGFIKWSNGEGKQQNEIYYYHGTNERFTIDSYGSCYVTSLSNKDALEIISVWLRSDELINESFLFGSFTFLGPVSLMIYASNLNNLAQFVKSEKIGDQDCLRWFYCVQPDGPYIDFWFEEHSNNPVQLTISYPDKSNSSYTLYFTSFDPIFSKKDELITYPYGRGCQRKVISKTPPRIFNDVDTYSFDVEASLSYANPVSTVLMTARIAKYQGFYTYDLTEQSDQVRRVIYHPKLRLVYEIDPDTGECIKSRSQEKQNVYSSTLKWPKLRYAYFNLLDKSIYDVETAVYMGQTQSSEKFTMDVYEKTIDGFFLNGVTAQIVYFFPATPSISPKMGQLLVAPIRIEIKPMRLTVLDEMVDKIVLTTISFTTENIDFEDRWDISGCFDQPGDYTWFQISYPTVFETMMRSPDLVRVAFSERLFSVIPRVRVPEIRVQIEALGIFITAKLIDRPNLSFQFYSRPNSMLDNPSSILIRENEKECSELCADDQSCLNYVYCPNRECRFFSFQDLRYEYSTSSECVLYIKDTAWRTPSSEFEVNLLKSSKKLLQEIKDMMNQGLLNTKWPTLEAEDMFIVKSPDQIGGFEDELRDNHVTNDLTDSFKLIFSGKRLQTGQTFIGQTYDSCFKLCHENDDCLTVSFCSNKNGECMLSSQPSTNITIYVSRFTSTSEGCNMFSRSYISYFKKLPGRSLIVDAEKILENTQLEDCSRVCAQSQDEPCASFDFCPSMNVKNKNEAVCFLHSFHIAKDYDNLIENAVWNFSNAKCDHYSKILSKDYTELIGRKLSTDIVIGEFSDTSLERCAGECGSSLQNCVSFEFCEDANNVDSVETHCRLSSFKPSNSDASPLTTATNEQCSVYVDPRKKAESEPSNEVKFAKLELIYGLGSLLFIVSTVLGLIGSHFYFKYKVKPQN